MRSCLNHSLQPWGSKQVGVIMTNDALTSLLSLVQDKLPHQEEGWHTTDELLRAAPDTPPATIRSRIAAAVAAGKAECKKALVQTTSGMRVGNVYRFKGGKP